MSGSLNRVTLIGNLGKDPEVRTTNDGREIVNFTVATSESWKDKTGERQEKTSWHNVVIFSEGLVKVAKQYLVKGSKALVEGQLQTRKWTDRDGNDRYSTEVVLQGFDAKLILLSPPSDRSDPRRDNAAPARNADTNSPADLIDEEIPFGWLLAIGTSAAALASQILPVLSA